MKSILSLIGIFLICTTSAIAQVGIGIETPDASTILHLESTNSGLLLPRLTTAEREAIALPTGPGPANGLTIYNTTTSAVEINIGTSTAPNWSLLTTGTATGPVLAPSYSTTDMGMLPTTPGSLIYNTDENCLFQYKGTPFDKWQSLCEAESSKIVTLYRDANGVTVQGNSSYNNFPLGSDQVQEIDTDYFEVVNNGKIKVLQAGTYLINASWEVTNLKGGAIRKFILAVVVQGTLRGYLNRGTTEIDGDASFTDNFGVSGAFQYTSAANDVIDIQYWINNGSSNNDLNGGFMHIGIIKL
jgi:hypothetical protein